MNEEININLRGKISYSDLRSIIFSYFKKTEGVELGSVSINYLQNKLATDSEPRPFFYLNEEFGETRFDVPKEDIEKIFRLYLVSKDCELLSGLTYNTDDTIMFDYKLNKNIKNELSVPENKVELNINYNGIISYSDLRQIVFDYFKEKQGVELSSISIDYLADQLKGENKYNGGPFFIRNDGFGETRFDIPKEDIERIFRTYLASKNYELTELNFRNDVEFKYKKNKKNISSMGAKINEYGEIIREGNNNSLSSNDNVPYFEPPLTEEANTDFGKTSENVSKEETKVIINNSSADELTKMAREQRKFTILQRERTMSEAQKCRNRSAIMAGICILGAAASVYFNGQDVSQVIQHELDAIYSWEALGQYIQDLGPLTTLLSTGAAGFIANYLKNSRKFKKAQHEFEDFNASLENVNAEKLGGNDNAKSR